MFKDSVKWQTQSICILPSSVQTWNFNWNETELALFSYFPPPTPTRESSEIVGIWINFISNISRDTQGDLKTAFKKFEVVFQPKLFEVIFQN